MNVYDFDKTIYDGDCTVDFIKYCLVRDFSLSRYFPSQLIALIKYGLKITRKEEFKESVYQIVTKIDDLDEWVEDFWNQNEHKIKEFYVKNKKSDDLIISASPEFLILPICNRLNIKAMASRIDTKTGKHSDGINCHGQRKVERFREIYQDTQVEEFYSDSFTDEPCAMLATQAYFVIGKQILPWEEAKKRR